MTHSQPLVHQNVVRFARPLDPVAPRAVVAPSGLDAFTSRLSALGKLSMEEVSLIRGLGRFARSHLPGTEIGADAAPMMSRVVLSGWACQQRMLGDGRRQIISFLLPGDVIGSLEPLDLPADYSVMALTQVITVDATALVKAVASNDPAYRGLARMVRLLAHGETTMLRDQIVRLGRQTAYERMVHLMLELHARLQVGRDRHYRHLRPADHAGGPRRCPGSECRAYQPRVAAGAAGRTAGDPIGQVKILDLEAMRTVADWMPASIEASVSRSARLA